MSVLESALVSAVSWAADVLYLEIMGVVFELPKAHAILSMRKCDKIQLGGGCR